MNDEVSDAQGGLVPVGSKILYMAGDLGNEAGGSATVIYFLDGQCYEVYREVDTMPKAETKALSKDYVRGLLDAAYLNMLDTLGVDP